MFSFISIRDYHHLLNTGAFSCEMVVEYYLQKISTEDKYNAFVETFPKSALTQARKLDEKRKAGLPLGKLYGVIISIKDVISYKNHSVSAASKILIPYTAQYSATAVEKLLAEDAIIIGRNNCDEFAMGSSNENSAYGSVKNALDIERVPGGSSGGSAVAIQAGLAMVSLGTDTGGSVRQPADFCGIFGIKPTYGRISRYGVIAYASSFDQIGVFSKNVEDAALVLEVIAGADGYDSTALQTTVPNYSADLALPQGKKYKLAYFKESLDNDTLDPYMASTINTYLKKLEQAGHQVVPIDFKWMDALVPTYYILSTAEASSNLARYDGIRYGHQSKKSNENLDEFYKNNRNEGFGHEVKKRIMLGTFVLSTGYYDAYFTKAQQIRQLLKQTTESIFEQYDFIVSPTVPNVAWKFGEKNYDSATLYLSDIFTVFANLVGIPAASLPLFMHEPTKMPFGLQIMSSHLNELSLLRFCTEASIINQD